MDTLIRFDFEHEGTKYTIEYPQYKEDQYRIYKNGTKDVTPFFRHDLFEHIMLELIYTHERLHEIAPDQAPYSYVREKAANTSFFAEYEDSDAEEGECNGDSID